jgi:hypothetical protein
VFDQVMSAIIEALLAFPPIRFLMGVVDSRWRPFWAALWIAVMLYLVARTLHYFALRRASLRILSEPMGGVHLAVPHPPGDRDRVDATSPAATNPTVRAPSASRQNPPRTGAPEPERVPSIPVPVVGAALVIGAAAVATVAMLMRATPNDSRDPAVASDVAPAADSARAAAPFDIRWRSGRPDDGDCIGTFEVTHGTGTRAGLVAFAMDSSGAIIARDSAQMSTAVTGMLVDFRFRNVDCDEIGDWQIQATTPGPRQQ